MNSYHVIIKKDPKSASWDDTNLIVFATSFANAEDKSMRFIPKDGFINSITYQGEAQPRQDVVIIKNRY